MPWLIFQRRFYSSFVNVVRREEDGRICVLDIIILLYIILFTAFAFSVQHPKKELFKVIAVFLWFIYFCMHWSVLNEWVKEAKKDMLEQMSVLYTSNVEAESSMSSEDNLSAEARSIVFEVTEREAYLRSEEDIETKEKSTQPTAEAEPDSEQQSEDSEEILSSEEKYRSSEEKSVGLRTRKYDRTSRPN